MNCKPGDLAYIVGNVPEAGCIVECIRKVPKMAHWPDFEAFWECRAVRPLEGEFGFSTDIVVPDCALRPISGVPVDDETPIETNIPEALQLALGIQARVWA